MESVRTSSPFLVTVAVIAFGAAGCGDSGRSVAGGAKSPDAPASTPAAECDDLPLEVAKSVLAEPSLTSIGDDCTYTDASDGSTLDLSIIGPENLTDGAGTDTMSPEEFFDGTKETSPQISAPDFTEPTGLGEKAYAGSYVTDDGKGEGAVVWFGDGRYISLTWAGYGADEAEPTERLVTVAQRLNVGSS